MTTRSVTAGGPAPSWAEQRGWTGPGRTSPRPRLLACLLLALELGTVVVGALVLRVVAPGLSGTGAALAVTVLLTSVTLVLVARVSGVRAAGFTGPRSWQRPWLFVVPAVLVPVPLLAGVRPVEAGTMAVLVVGYALTGFTEEALWRGVVLRVLRPAGPATAVLFSSALFGAAHLGNVLFRDNVALVVAQAVGAACFGVGYAAVALRTGTIWPLMVLHMLTDLFAVPAVLVPVPLLAGVRPVEAGTMALLVVGYALTGFTEEALWRGVVLRVLRPAGHATAVLFSSALFGAAHLGNVLFRDNVALVVAQAVGAACFGVGYAAVALRTGTIWPLMLLHMLTDLFAAVGALPKIPILVGQDVVLLVLGLLVLRRVSRRQDRVLSAGRP